jgi:S-formylglutathione hydrolase FrmB
LRFRLFRFSLLLVVSSVALILIACDLPELPRADRPVVDEGARLQDVVFYSPALDRNMKYRVLFPADPPAGRRYPVAYLLHGAGDDFRDWSNSSDVSKYAAKGMILVMPEGDLSYYVNAARTKSDRYEDYITRDLIADVESRFPAKADRRNRAVVGISMGGYGAVYYALARSELFAYVGAISPAVDAPSRDFSWRHIDKWLRFRRIFGPDDSDVHKSYDPFWIVQKADPQATPYMYLTSGDSEPFFEPIKRFSVRLHERGFAYEMHIMPGGHDWNEWKNQVPGCFAKLLEIIPLENGIKENTPRVGSL